MTFTRPDGRTIIGNRYHLQAALHDGPAWVIHRAYDSLTGRVVALKRLTHMAVGGANHEARQIHLTREFQALASLRHPYIVSALEYGVDAGRNPYFTLEYPPGAVDLFDATARADWRDKARLLLQMLEGLAYLHQRGLHHRSLVPAGILVTPERCTKLAYLDLDIGVTGGEAHPYTEATLPFTAPEVLRGGAFSPSSDLYAVGVIAYHLLTRRAPFTAESLDRMMIAILTRHLDSAPLIAAHNSALARVVLRLMARSPEERYSSAVDAARALCEAADLPVPEAALGLRGGALQPTAFVGRELELTRLKLSLEQAIRGYGSAWLVGGMSGVGKTRLLEELRLHALSAGVLTVRGGGVAEGGLAYQVWREPARRLALTAGLSDADASILKEIVPDIGVILRREIPDAPILDGVDHQRRLVSTITRLLLWQKQPILLILEDLHWAIESLEPLRLLFPLARDLPVMVVGSYRDDEMPDLPARLPRAEHLTVAPFDAATTERLSAMLLRGLPLELARWMQRETAGNAFLIIEAARALIDAASPERAGHAAPTLRYDLGQARATVQAVLQARIERLPRPALALLRLAAVAGRQLDLSVLRAALREAGEAEMPHALLAVCERAALLRYEDHQWAFAHDKLRDLVIATLEPGARAALHRRVARALETVYPADEGKIFLLYEHWREADDPARLAEVAWRAGLERKRLAGFAEARALLEESLALYASLGADDGRADNVPAMAVRLALGEVCWHLAAHADAATVLEQILAWEGAAEHADLAANALFWLSQIEAVQGHYDEAGARLEMALALAPPDDIPTLARLHYGLGDVAWRTERLALAAEHIDASLGLARQFGDLTLMMYALNRLGSIYFFQHRLDDAERCHLENRQIALAASNRERAIAAIGNLGEIARLRGEYTRAVTLYQEALGIARDIGHRHYMALLHSYLGQSAMAMGQHEMAQAELMRALKLAYDQGAPALMLAALAPYAQLRVAQGAPAEAAEWAGLILSHPAADVNIRNDLGALVETLSAALGTVTFGAHFENGKALMLAGAVGTLLADGGAELA